MADLLKPELAPSRQHASEPVQETGDSGGAAGGGGGSSGGRGGGGGDDEDDDRGGGGDSNRCDSLKKINKLA